MKIKKTTLVIPLLAFLFYSGLFIPGYAKFRTATDNGNYFKSLAASFMHGRLDVELINGGDHDLVEYKGKYYLYWPPVPAFIMMPVVAVYGVNTPDHMIVAFFGALNVLLLLFLVRRFVSILNVELSNIETALLLLFWAFGTVHFYMSMVGNVWYLSQIMAQTFLISSLLSLLTVKNRMGLVISGLFFACAVYTKNDLVFSCFMAMAFYFLVYGIKVDRRALIDAAVFISPFIFFTILNYLYNYARFGNIFDNGIKYHLMDDYFRDNFNKYGYMSLHYFKHNFRHELFGFPPFIADYPFIKHRDEGFGLFWASPLFLVIFIPVLRLFREMWIFLRTGDFRGFLDKGVIMTLGLVLSGIFISSVIFMIMGTGWVQFASRYSLDYQLMMFLLVIIGAVRLSKSPAFKWTAVIFLVWSIYINWHGMKLYLSALNL